MITTIEISTKIKNTKYSKLYSEVFKEISEKLTKFITENKLEKMGIEYLGNKTSRKNCMIKVDYRFVTKDIKKFKVMGRRRNPIELADKAS